MSIGWTRAAGDRGWTPNPVEILQRKCQVKFMQLAGFSPALMDSIMIRDTPEFAVVRRMVVELGVDETRERLEWFVFEE